MNQTAIPSISCHADLSLINPYITPVFEFSGIKWKRETHDSFPDFIRNAFGRTAMAVYRTGVYDVDTDSVVPTVSFDGDLMLFMFDGRVITFSTSDTHREGIVMQINHIPQGKEFARPGVSMPYQSVERQLVDAAIGVLRAKQKTFAVGHPAAVNKSRLLDELMLEIDALCPPTENYVHTLGKIRFAKAVSNN